jgi:uncharacterized membrane protein
VLPAAAAAIVAVALVSSPRGAATASGTAGAEFREARAVMERRCVPCHSAAPTGPWYATAPMGVTFDTPEEISSQAARIEQQAVATEVMPLGNLTGMTAAERAVLAAWIRAGAPAR